MIHWFRRLWNGETDGLTAAAFIVGGASLASRVVGVLRDRLLAATFGAGDMLDAYYAAFRVPDTLYNLLILGALSAGFIPVFAEWMEKRGKDQAIRLAEQVLSVIALAVASASAILCVLVPFFMPWIAPGFSGDKLELAILLTRIMLLSPVFLGLSAVMGGVLQSTRRFFAYAVAPVLYNLGIILGILLLAPSYGVAGVAAGVVLGAVMHFFAQAGVAWQLGVRHLVRPSLKPEGVRLILKHMAPRTLGLAVSQINLIILLAIASTLGAGSVAVFNLANNLQSFPLGLFGISFAIAAFPALARAVGKNDEEGYREALGSAGRKIVFLVLPAMALFILLRAQIVRLVLGQGAFSWDDTIRTADVLGWFSLSLVAQSLVPLLTRAFYARQIMRTPIVIVAACELFAVAFALLLKGPFGISGLAIAFSISAVLQLVLLTFALRAHVGPLGRGDFLVSGYKTVIATIALCVIGFPLRELVGTLYPLRTFAQVFLQALAAIAGGGAAFLLTAWIVKSPELIEFASAAKRRLWRRATLKESVDQASGMA